MQVDGASRPTCAASGRCHPAVFIIRLSVTFALFSLLCRALRAMRWPAGADKPGRICAYHKRKGQGRFFCPKKAVATPLSHCLRVGPYRAAALFIALRTQSLAATLCLFVCLCQSPPAAAGRWPREPFFFFFVCLFEEALFLFRRAPAMPKARARLSLLIDMGHILGIFFSRMRKAERGRRRQPTTTAATAARKKRQTEKQSTKRRGCRTRRRRGPRGGQRADRRQTCARCARSDRA